MRRFSKNLLVKSDMMSPYQNKVNHCPQALSKTRAQGADTGLQVETELAGSRKARRLKVNGCCAVSI